MRDSNPPDVVFEKPSKSQQQQILQGHKDAADCMDYLRVGGVTCPDNEPIITHEESDCLTDWNNRNDNRINSSKGKVPPFGITRGAFFYEPRIHQLEIMKEGGGQHQYALVSTSITMDS